MRVSSLSDKRVIELITKYFVPAWVSRDDYQLDPRSEAERAELERLDRDRSKRKLKGGTVCVFVIDPDGSVLATQPVQQAYKPENLVPFLEKIVADKHLQPRDAESIRASAAVPAAVKPKTDGGRLVHIYTRCDQSETNGGLSQDRIELTAQECKAFAPAADAKAGASWKIPESIARKLFQFCYPPQPHWKATDCKVLTGTLKATLIAVSARESRLKLEGEMKLSFPHSGKPTDGRITAQFVGLAHWDARKQRLMSLALVSERAEYVWFWQDKPQPIKMRIAVELEP